MSATQRRNSATAVANRRTRLTSKGCGAVAVTVAVLVLLAGHGHAGAAALVGLALYCLVTGRASVVASIIPSARQSLRGLAWVAVAVAFVTASQGTTAAGGPLLGVALAAALGTYLKLTATASRRRRS